MTLAARRLRRLLPPESAAPAELPSPGSAPLARPGRAAVVVLIVIVIGLLALGYRAPMAVNVLAAVGMIGAELAAWLGLRPAGEAR